MMVIRCAEWSELYKKQRVRQYIVRRRVADFVTQMRKMVWHTTLLRLVSIRYTQTPPSLLTVILKHAFCRFLVSPAWIRSQVIHNVDSCTCLAHWRFLHFHGQRHARLISYQSVYDKPKHERSPFIWVVSPMLFLAPKDHLREMERLWTDEIIVERVWKSVMNKLVQDWERVILWVRVQRPTAQRDWLSSLT